MSSTSGVTATKLIDKLCDGKVVTREDIDEVYHGKLQCSKDDLYEASQGFITDHHIFLLQTIKRDIESTESLISELGSKIKESLSEYDNSIEALRGIPGLNTKTVEDLIAEIGLDMSVFPTEKHLASWAGMSPGNNESAGKKKAEEPPTGTNR
jgi:transposase